MSGANGAKPGSRDPDANNDLLNNTTPSPPSYLFLSPAVLSFFPFHSPPCYIAGGPTPYPFLASSIYSMVVSLHSRECLLSHDPSGRPFWKVGALTIQGTLLPTVRPMLASSRSCWVIHPSSLFPHLPINGIPPPQPIYSSHLSGPCHPPQSEQPLFMHLTEWTSWEHVCGDRGR